MHHVIHHFTAFLRSFRGAQRQVARLTGVFGVLLHGGGQLFHAGRGLFQGSGLLLGTGREIVVTHRDFARAAVDGIRTVTHVANGTHQLALHVAQRVGQFTHLIGAFNIDTLHQVAAGDMTNAVDQAIQRRNQRLLDAQPDGDNHHHHGNQHANQHPDSLAVRAVAVFHRRFIQLVVLLQVAHVLLLKTVLIALGRLVEEGVDFPGAQQLNQLSQRAVVDLVITFDFQRSGVALTRIARQGFVIRPVFFRLLQRGRRNLHQIGNGRAAADVALIHHVTDTRAVQGVTGLQQGNPAPVEGRLLLTNGLQDGEILFVILQGIKEKTTGCEL